MCDSIDDKIRKKLEAVIEAGYVAIDELVEVARRKIVFDSADESVDELKVDKLKIAAQAKKIAIFDSVDIADKIIEINKKLNPSTNDKVDNGSEKKEILIASPESRASS
tara:strand:- start:183 stop:509 length:327 start_codon:yes stop_codon:yes gene_type:complete